MIGAGGGVALTLSPEMAGGAAEALWARLEPALRDVKAGRYLAAHARLSDPEILKSTGFKLVQPAARNEFFVRLEEFRSSGDFARVLNDRAFMGAPDAGFVEGLGFVVRMPYQIVTFGGDAQPLFHPKLKDHLIIRQLRRNYVLYYAEEYLHVLQFLKDRAGGAFYLSRALRDPKIRQQSAVRDESPAEADVYAFLLEALGPAEVPAWIGARYNSRRAIDQLYR